MLTEKERAKKLKEKERAKKLKEKERAKKLKEKERAKKLKEKERQKKTTTKKRSGGARGDEKCVELEKEKAELLAQIKNEGYSYETEYALAIVNSTLNANKC